jgi:hypothetical protein
MPKQRPETYHLSARQCAEARASDATEHKYCGSVSCTKLRCHPISTSQRYLKFSASSHLSAHSDDGPCFEDADIPNVPASKFAPPQIVPTAAILPQGSRGFYAQAYRALLPPHAPDMLTVRIQVIDGTGTFTLSDSQPCRLLTLLHRLRNQLLGFVRRLPSYYGGADPSEAAAIGHLRQGQML